MSASLQSVANSAVSKLIGLNDIEEQQGQALQSDTVQKINILAKIAPYLSKLEWEAEDLLDEHIPLFSQFKKLQVLTLVNAQKLTVRCFENIHKIKTLRTLKFTGACPFLADTKQGKLFRNDLLATFLVALDRHPALLQIATDTDTIPRGLLRATDKILSNL